MGDKTGWPCQQRSEKQSTAETQLMVRVMVTKWSEREKSKENDTWSDTLTSLTSARKSLTGKGQKSKFCKVKLL